MRDWRGLVLGVVERNPFRVRITLGTKQVIELQNDDRAVVLDDQRIGSTITRSGQMELRLDRPILPSLAAMILLVRRRHDA